MVFGEDLFFKDCGNIDVIESKGFIHTDVAIREGLIFPYRNGVMFGNYFEKVSNIESNLLIRIKRQLYQARLFLDNKIGCGCDNIYREHKALSRLTESAILLSKFFPNFPVEKKRIWEYENHCGNVDKDELDNLYKEISKFVNFESKQNYGIKN